ncbi:MAG TPA: DsbE family thiol:disulfide interchange protein [Hyphomicrobiaceae bacterium]|nr:DsbE family thiol:disulfide interchange protein [Hyphomicrobiaceae bacterium]
MTTPAEVRPRAGYGRVAPVAIFAVLAVVFLYALFTGDPTKLPSALIGKQAPAIAFPAVEELRHDGKPVPGIEPSDLTTGKPVVVNFWASWCAPCVAEHPLLVALKEKYGATILGVNYKDQAANARRFLGRYGNPYTAVGADLTGRNAIEWGVYGMPETFVLDGAGRIVYKHVGQITPETLETKIVPALRQAGRLSTK